MPTWPITNPSANSIFETGWVGTTSWVGFPTLANWTGYQPRSDETGFWEPLATNQPGAFLDLVLWVLAQGHMLTLGVSLADAIKDHLLAVLLASVSDISQATLAQWQTLFSVTIPAAYPGVTTAAALPPLIGIGTDAARIAAFIQWVQQFFQLGTAAPLLNPMAAAVLPRFGVPTYDLIARTIADYPGFFLSMATNIATLEAAAAVAIPGDDVA